jgi:serine/threonine protein kinase/tetratricopeptide (TPR) repeat protein
MPEFPHSVDRFEIIRLLGKGGMGAVYLAKDQRLDRQVALKVLHADDLGSEDRRARFLREARTAAAVRHANVATIYETGETDDGSPFLVMEFCEGETLAQRMRRRPLEAAEFLSIARQVTSGLVAAHEQGVIHRDLKAANIMIEPTGVAKILDFGLAKMLQRSTNAASVDSTTGHFFGTLHFLSPEQARGQQADARSDLFSLGIVLYQMASGHLPFNADAPLMVLEKIRDSEPEPFVPLDTAFPATAARIIGKLLQKEPAARYQSAAELLTDLDEIDTPTVRFSTTHTRTGLGPTTRRHHWTRWAITLGSLLVVAAAILFGRRQMSSETRAMPDPAAKLPPIHSLAVLPLENLARNTKDDFLSVSLADALVTKLQQVPSLQVRPTSAIIEYHRNKVDTRTAGETLKVDGVLEGRFLDAGDLVRVNLQLTDSRTGYNIWADTVDGKRTDLLKLIDDVSNRTLLAMNQKLGAQQAPVTRSQARSSNPKAYEEYLKARALNGSFVPSEHAAQIAALKRAIDADPNFAAAYADLAIALSLSMARGQAVDAATLGRADWYARQAVRLDSNLPEAHLAMGRVFVRDPARFRESTREALAAVRLNPRDSTSLERLVTYFVSSGDLAKAQCVGDKLVAIDPSSNEARTRAYWYLNAVDAEGALRNADIALASKDTAFAGHDVRGYSFILLGKLDEAEVEAREVSKLVPGSYTGKSLMAMVAAARGDRPRAEEYLRSFEADANLYHWAAFRQMLCYARLGDREKALAWLQVALDHGNHSWYALVKHPWLVTLTSDARFQAAVGKVKADLDDVADDVEGVYQLICGAAGKN